MHSSPLFPELPPAEPRAPETAERVARLAKRFPDRIDALVALCRGAADPDLALAGVERYVDGAQALPAARDLLEALVLLCGASRMIAQLLARDPRLLVRAARSPLLEQPRT